MPEITAAAVKALREKTNLPMMDCKKALEATDGDEAAAIDKLRKEGKKMMEGRGGRETSSGRIAQYIDTGKKVGAMIELRCESAPVANNEEFMALANNLAKQLALGPGAKTADELWKQPSPGKPGKHCRKKRTIWRTKFAKSSILARIVRFDGVCGGLRASQRRQRRADRSRRGHARGGQGYCHAHRRHASAGGNQGRA